MAREIYVLREGRLVRKAEALAAGAPRGEGPYVICDGMDPVRNMADGRLYDSRSAYHRAVRAAGCEVVGNDRPSRSSATLPPVGADLKRAIEQLGG